MELQAFDLTNARDGKPGEATLRVYNNGRFHFNKQSAVLLGITDESRIKIFCDKTRPEDWYIAKIEDEKAFPVKLHKGGFIVYSASLAYKITSSLEMDSPPTAISFPLAKKPVEDNGKHYYAILTKARWLAK